MAPQHLDVARLSARRRGRARRRLPAWAPEPSFPAPPRSSSSPPCRRCRCPPGRGAGGAGCRPGHRRRRPSRRARPHGPSPEIRICWPSWMPAGTSTSSVRSSTDRPDPSQSRQGRSTTRPAPPQPGQVCERTNSPNAVRETCCRWPRPPQVAQTTGSVPGSAPLPRQVAQGTVTGIETSRLTPVAASASSISIRAATSAPRALLAEQRRRRRRRRRSAANRSERLPRSKLEGVKPPPRRPACP